MINFGAQKKLDMMFFKKTRCPEENLVHDVLKEKHHYAEKCQITLSKIQASDVPGNTRIRNWIVSVDSSFVSH